MKDKEKSMGCDAILMAAGMGTRMRPITEKMPKPLVKIAGKPMIETVIDGLNDRNIDDIYVVTGYLGEQFNYLKTKYKNVHLLHNPDYEVKNNISSVYAAKEVLGISDVFICEADLYVSDSRIFLKELNESCYYGKMVEGYSDDWLFEIKDGYISRVGKGGMDCYNMVGISFWKQNDAAILKEKIIEAYGDDKNFNLFWDDVVNMNLRELKLKVEPVFEDQLVEIDTVLELEEVQERLKV